MFLPEGVDFPREEGDPEGLAGFMAVMQRAAAASIRDQSDARAMVPIMATVPDSVLPYLDQLKPTTFWSELSAEIGEMKERAINRLASSTEIPAEVLTGIGDANHWTAWLISDEGIRWIKGGYLGPVADALTRGFLRLALASMGIPNPERYAYAFDTSTLAAKPNRLEDAGKLRDHFLISDEEYVRAGAFDPKVIPSVPERAVQILLRAVQAQPDLMLDPEVQRLLGLPPIQSVGLPATSAQNADGTDPDTEDDPADGPPNGGEPPAEPDPSETRALTEALGARVRALEAPSMPALPSPEAVFNAAAKLTILRALELAGGRLTTPGERRGRWSEVPRHELHHWVGPITPERARKVTEDAWRHVPVLAADLGVNADDLRDILEGYVLELLTRGIRHHDDFLFAALQVANRGRGMVAA
jgi:hypothetical protein